MKPLTNETLIEELIEKHISLESYEAVDGRMITMKEAKDDIMVVNVHGLKKDLLSAIQAKEREIQEKIIGEIEKRFKMFEQSKTGWMITGINIRLEDWKEFKSKLSNLSEK
jgi:hypothetical protein